MGRKGNNLKTITISSKRQLHDAMGYISDECNLSLSGIVREALQKAEIGDITKDNANLSNGGFYRTVVNISDAEEQIIRRYCSTAKLSRSAVIRAAVTVYLQSLSL